jgi:hypothetical protein
VRPSGLDTDEDGSLAAVRLRWPRPVRTRRPKHPVADTAWLALKPGDTAWLALKPGAQTKFFECCDAQAMSQLGLVSRVTPVQTAMRNWTRDEGRSFEVGNQVLISNHRKLLWSKATVVNVAEKSEQDSGRYD